MQMGLSTKAKSKTVFLTDWENFISRTNPSSVEPSRTEFQVARAGLSPKTESTMKARSNGDRPKEKGNQSTIIRVILMRDNGKTISQKARDDRYGRECQNTKANLGKESSRVRQLTKDWDNMNIRASLLKVSLKDSDG
jgi:hypothetical protein